jgi:hypothetical protein
VGHSVFKLEWCPPVITALQRQEVCQFKASLNYLLNPCLKKSYPPKIIFSKEFV